MPRGAVIVNDVSGLLFDPDLRAVVAETGAAVVLMHNRGRSREMYREAVYTRRRRRDSPRSWRPRSRARSRRACARESIIVDPGLGFAKRAEHSYAALASLDVLAGTRSSDPVRPFTQIVSDGGHRDEGPPASVNGPRAAAVTASVLLGAHIVRVHRVAEMVDVVKVADRIREQSVLVDAHGPPRAPPFASAIR